MLLADLKFHTLTREILGICKLKKFEKLLLVIGWVKGDGVVGTLLYRNLNKLLLSFSLG